MSLNFLDRQYKWTSDLKNYCLHMCWNALWLAGLYLLLCALAYWRATRANRKQQSSKRALLVVAHPDDECMFFGPTILSLASQGTDIHLLCLSIGNYYNEGHVRRSELYKACEVLNIKNTNITICIDTLMADNPGIYWPSEHVAKIILQYIESLSIDTLITFDKKGVSGHLNHSSIFYSIARLFVEKKVPKECKVFVLDSVNFIRKYWGYLDLPLSYLLSSHRYILSVEEKKKISNAMKQHKSQMVWFRRLYLIFSRFTAINTLRHVTLTDLELELQIDD